jgi:hypothetical protein
VSGVVHINIVPQMTVVKGECALRKSNLSYQNTSVYRTPFAAHTSSLDPSLACSLAVTTHSLHTS